MKRILKKGDLLIEHAVYCVEEVGTNNITVKLVQKDGNKFVKSNDSIAIQDQYADAYLKDGVNYETVVKVTTEDKKDGTLGIRSIFENIPPYEPFSVLYTKQDVVLSKKAYLAKQEEQLTTALELVEKAKSSKKSISEAAKEAFKMLQENPISPIVPGEDRVLVGYKLSNKYDCVDFNILEVRPVNINTLKEVVVNGVKYVRS